MRVWFSTSTPRKGAWWGRKATSPESVRVTTMVDSPE